MKIVCLRFVDVPIFPSNLFAEEGEISSHVGGRCPHLPLLTFTQDLIP